jgi:glucose/arabinose dehydrogenase
MRSVAVRAVLVLAFTAALAVGPSSVARGGPAATDPGIAQTIVARSVATGLGFPAGFTFAPDGRIFYGERFTGELRVINPSTGTNRLFFTVPNLTSSGEQGLLAVALHPSYPSVPQVFLYATRLVGGSPHGQILRITNQGGTGTGLRVVRDLGVATQNHNGGRLLFGPDGKLYLSIGDRLNPANSQNLAVLPGKVLRLNPDGSVPADNPVAGQSAVRLRAA